MARNGHERRACAHSLQSSIAIGASDGRSGRREHLDQQDMGMLPATKLAELADLADVKGWRVARVGERLRATLPR